MTTTTPSETPTKPNRVRQWWSDWLKPRSQDRDEAFRERTLRVTILILVISTALSFVSSLPIFGYTYTFLSYETMTGIMLVTSLYAGRLVSQGKVNAAGWTLVATLIIGVIGVTLIEGFWGILTLPAYMIVWILVALVLPLKALSRVFWATFFMFVAIALLQENTDLRDYTSDFAKRVPAEVSVLYMINMLLLGGVQVLFLRQLRGEFDSRLAAMEASIVETEKARQEAVSANEAKSRFFAKMTHELRTPLNAIIGYVELMIAGMAGDFNDKQKRFHENIHFNGKRLLDLVNDLLDLSKAEAGKIELHYTATSPQSLVNDVVSNMQSLATQKNIVLDANYAKDIPSEVYCDVRKVQQAVINLVGNAIKFTNEGGVYVSVKPLDQDHWQILVKDTGTGIPEKALNSIFEVFSQVGNTDVKGTGLGLAITKELITSMDGTVTVESTMGEGSTFIITLPHVKPEAEPEPDIQAEPKRLSA